MSQSLGDFATSTVVYGKFTTYRPSTGAPHTLAGTPALSVYKDNSTTQSTTGVTLTADFDSVTGFNHFAIDTSADGTFYSAGSFFDIVVTTGTVDSVSAVGTVVGSFTLEKGAAFARIGATGSGLTSLASQTSVNTIDDFLDTEIAAILVAVDTEVAAILEDTGTTLPAQIAALNNLSAAAAADAVWDEARAGHVGAGTFGEGVASVQGNVTGSVGSVTAGVSVAVGGIGATSFAAAAIDAAAIAPNAIGASELAQDAAQEIADEVLNRNLAGGGSGNTRNVRNALRSLRNRAAISAGTLTVYQEDDTTSAWTAAVTTAAGDPLSEVDPA